MHTWANLTISVFWALGFSRDAECSYLFIFFSELLSDSLKLELTAQPPSRWFIFALTPLAINSVLMRLLRSFAIISVSDENRTRKWVTFCYQPHLGWLHWEGGDELFSRFPAAVNLTLCYLKRKPFNLPRSVALWNKQEGVGGGGSAWN